MSSHLFPSPQEPCAPVNWLELPADVCTSIIWRLHVVEILTSVQYVCSMWRHICRDPSMWRSIDFVWDDEYSNYQYDLSKLYRLAADLSSGGLVYLNLEYCFYSDGLLQHIADRSKHLRRIRLGYCFDFSEAEFFEAFEKLPVLEELDICNSNICCHFSSEYIATISRLCPLLYSFKIDVVSEDIAFAIAKNMPGLRHLEIAGSWMTKDGLLAILDGCQHLESLDLSACFLNLDEGLKRRCAEQIKDFDGPHDCDESDDEEYGSVSDFLSNDESDDEEYEEDGSESDFLSNDVMYQTTFLRCFEFVSVCITSRLTAVVFL